GHALRVEVGVPGAQRRVHEVGPDRVVLRGDPHEAADHARDHRLRHVGHEVARLAALEPVQHLDGDATDRRLVLGDPPWRAPGLARRSRATSSYGGPASQCARSERTSVSRSLDTDAIGTSGIAVGATPMLTGWPASRGSVGEDRAGGLRPTAGALPVAVGPLL